ncbi:hypothetical protein KOR42_55380 [Thalassoglobus neptunius]|uniref:Secretin/TonB short N-terminal domain-containing protein n=1 Tax=Thalassoglobus neptunius TaxID=1938619 RepID=A0A5C5UV63_9PLAN|nr:STN domain-containing protein [Thalassoglobus neptunius]TWT29255.1 hypothetical protein KOR42_55380 [Thalassoglobus neptunius]
MRVFCKCMTFSMGILGLVIMSSQLEAQVEEIQLEEVRPPVIGTIVVPEEEQAQSDENPFGPSSVPDGTPGDSASGNDPTRENSDTLMSRQKIEEALQQSTLVDFIETPLGEIADYLSDVHQIPILFDHFELSNEGISTDDELTFNVSGVSLEDALTLSLESLNLGFVIKNNVVIITPKHLADEHYETRVYDVRGLYIDDPEALADVLIHTTGDNTWKEQGGNGDLSFIHSSFIVRQNRATHHEIRHLLDELRRNLKGHDDLPGWPKKERNGDSQSPEGGGLGSGFGGGGASTGGGGGGFF